MDVTNIDSVNNLMNELYDIDILVNSAGIARHTPTIDTTVADFDDVVRECEIRIFFSSVIAKKMIAKGVGGSIIQISSQMGHEEL